MIDKITADLVISWRPCWLGGDDGEARIRALLPTPHTPIQIIDRWLLGDLPDVGADDILWLLLRPKVVSERDLRLWACDCVERSLAYWDLEYPYDRRPHDAIEVGRKYARGEATREEMKSARAAARSSASAAWSSASAARSAARSAGEYVGYTPWLATAVARSVARAASRAARAAGDSTWIAEYAVAAASESRWQIERLRQYLAGEVK